MPRPRQRRGGESKKEAQRLQREEAEARAAQAERERKKVLYSRTKLDIDRLPEATEGEGQEHDGIEAENQLDPDTKAYFLQIAKRIDELEELGVGTSGSKQQEDDDEEPEDDDRQLLLKSSLTSLSGHELPLALDSSCSVVLERLLYSMSDFSKRVLADRFTGEWERIATHTCASHVLQTLIEVGLQTLDREARGIINTPPSAANEDDSVEGEPSVLPTLTASFVAGITSLLPLGSSLLFDPFGSHVLRSLLLLLSPDAASILGSTAAAKKEDSRRSAALPGARSKKSQQFRKAQGGQMKSFVSPTGTEAAVYKALKLPRELKAPIRELLKALFEEMDTVGASSAYPGDKIREAAMNDIAAPVLAVIIQLEAAGVLSSDNVSAKGKGKEVEDHWPSNGWADRLLFGLIADLSPSPPPGTEKERLSRSEQRAEYLGGVMRQAGSSIIFETVLQCASGATFARLFDEVVRPAVGRLAGHQVGNYVLASAINRIPSLDLVTGVVQELGKVGTSRRGEWIDQSRIGVWKALLDKLAELRVGKEDETARMAVRLIEESFEVDLEGGEEFALEAFMTLTRVQYLKKLPKEQRPQPSTQGSLLLQSWLRLPAPHNSLIFRSLLALGAEGLLPYARDPTASRVLDVVVESPTVPPKDRRAFVLLFLDSFVALTEDRVGSRFAENLFTTSDLFLKEKIAAALVGKEQRLQSTQFGHFLVRKVGLVEYGRKRGQWREGWIKRSQEEALAAKAAAAPDDKVEKVVMEAAEKVDEGDGSKKKKKRKKEDDEIDLLFKGASAVEGSGGGGSEKKKAKKLKKA